MGEEYFNNRSSGYEQHLNLPIISKIRDDEREIINKIIDDEILGSDVILEIGCGTGYYTTYLSKRCKSMLSIDLSDKMIETTREKIKKEEITNVLSCKADITKVRIPNVYDHVFCIGVFDYIIHPCKTFKKICEATSKTFIMTVPHKSFASSFMTPISTLYDQEYRSYDEIELKDILLGAGFKSVTIYETGCRGYLNRGATLIVVARK